MQPAHVTTQKSADDLEAKSCKVAEVYDEGILNDIFIKNVEASIRHNLRHNGAQKQQAYLRDVAFQAEIILFIQKDTGHFPKNNQGSCNEGKPLNRKSSNDRNTKDIFNKNTTSSTLGSSYVD